MTGIAIKFVREYDSIFRQPTARQLTVLGGGKVARSVCAALVARGCFKKSEIAVCTASASSASAWESFGYQNSHPAKDFYDAVPLPSGVVLVAVRPEQLPALLNDLKRRQWFKRDSAATVRMFSLVGNVDLAQLHQKFRDVGYNGFISRMAPFATAHAHPAVVLQGIASDPNDSTRLAAALGDALGTCIQVDEGDFNAACAVASVVPKLLSTTIEALAAAGTEAGLQPDLSTTVVTSMLASVSQMAQQSGRGAARLTENDIAPDSASSTLLRQRITSKFHQAFKQTDSIGPQTTEHVVHYPTRDAESTSATPKKRSSKQRVARSSTPTPQVRSRSVQPLGRPALQDKKGRTRVRLDSSSDSNDSRGRSRARRGSREVPFVKMTGKNFDGNPERPDGVPHVRRKNDRPSTATAATTSFRASLDTRSTAVSSAPSRTRSAQGRTSVHRSSGVDMGEEPTQQSSSRKATPRRTAQLNASNDDTGRDVESHC